MGRSDRSIRRARSVGRFHLAVTLALAEIPAFAMWIVMTREFGPPAPEIIERMAGMFALVAGTALGSLPLSAPLPPIIKTVASVVICVLAAVLTWIAAQSAVVSG